MLDDRLLEMSVELAKAHLATTQVPTSEVPQLVRAIFTSLKALTSPDRPEDSIEESRPIPPHFDELEPPIINKDVSGSEFEGLDPWLAARVPRRVARLLDPSSAVHPSVHEDILICLEDGARVKLLRAYLRKNHGMSLADYMDRWRLPADYPSAPAAYLDGKRAQAKASGLGVTLRGSRGPARAKVAARPRKAVRG